MADDEPYTAVDYLDGLANHFLYEDGWHWSRDSDIKRIEYKTVGRREKLGYRIKFTLQGLFGKQSRRFEKRLRLRTGRRSLRQWAISKWITVGVRLPKERHVPDGYFKENGVICFWEEDGEYISMMQPSVGKLLAKFLKDEPDNEWAKKITAELEDVRKKFWEDTDDSVVEE